MLRNYVEIIGWIASICIVVAGVLSRRTVSLYLNAVGSCCLIVYGGLSRSGIIIFLSTMLTGIRLYQLAHNPRHDIGCIIIGYQGIGKSSLASIDPRYIDLESSSFYIDGSRDANWYQPYCNIAIDLAIQGYRVFTSSHLVVREYLTSIELPSPLTLYICYPGLHLKDPWIDKLRIRQESTKLPKDVRAYQNAVDRFSDNILELKDCPGYHIELNTMSYDLNKEVSQAIQNNSKKF